MQRHLIILTTGAVVAVGLLGAALVYTVLPSLVVDDAKFASGVKDSAVEREQQRLRARNDARTTGLAALTLLGVAAGSALTWGTVRMTREGQVIDRLARGVEALGSTSTATRQGGVFQLEGVAASSRNERPTVTRLIVARLRELAGTWPPPGDPGADPRAPRSISSELDAVTGALARSRTTPESRKELALAELDLRNVDLRGADLRQANLTGSNLSGALLDGADLRGARLVAAVLDGTHLTKAKMRGCNATDATFDRARLDGVDLKGACLARASFTSIAGRPRRGLQGARQVRRNANANASRGASDNANGDRST